MQAAAGRWLSCLSFATVITTLLSVSSAAAQARPAVQQFLVQASQAFAGNQPVSAITLTGNADYTAGGTHESGQVTLIARADGSSSFELDAGSASRTESQDTFANGQGCTWSQSDGTNHTSSGQNCILPVAWFMPEVSLFGQQMPAGTVNLTTPSDAPGDMALRWTMPQPPGFSGQQAALWSDVGSWSLHFDDVSRLPTELRYSLHPDGNAGFDIPVRVLFTDYQAVQGIEIPFHIQRYFNGMLALDVTITNATIAR